MFSDDTLTFINKFNKGYYNNKKAIIFSNVTKDNMIIYAENSIQYLYKFIKCVKELPVRLLDENNKEDFLKNIKFDEYTNLNIYDNPNKEAFFFIQTENVKNKSNSHPISLELNETEHNSVNKDKYFELKYSSILNYGDKKLKKADFNTNLISKENMYNNSDNFKILGDSDNNNDI